MSESFFDKLAIVDDLTLYSKMKVELDDKKSEQLIEKVLKHIGMRAVHIAPSLNKEDYPLVADWDEKDYKKMRSNDGLLVVPNEPTDGGIPESDEGKRLDYLVDKDGRLLPLEKSVLVRKTCKQIWWEWKRVWDQTNQEPIYIWSEVPPSHLREFYNQMTEVVPELAYCTNFWKCFKVGTNYYPGWIRRAYPEASATARAQRAASRPPSRSRSRSVSRGPSAPPLDNRQLNPMDVVTDKQLSVPTNINAPALSEDRYDVVSDSVSCCRGWGTNLAFTQQPLEKSSEDREVAVAAAAAATQLVPIVSAPQRKSSLGSSSEHSASEKVDERRNMLTMKSDSVLGYDDPTVEGTLDAAAAVTAANRTVCLSLIIDYHN